VTVDGGSRARDIALVAAAVLLSPLWVPLLLLAGPAAMTLIGLHALAFKGWVPHPGEFIGAVMAPVGYTAGLIGVGINAIQSGSDWSAAWIVFGSVLVAAVALLWAAFDYRRLRGTSRG